MTSAIEYVTSAYPNQCFAFDQFGPLSTRLCHGTCRAPRKHPVRLRATCHRTRSIRYFHGYSLGGDQLRGVTREHKGGDCTPAALKRSAPPGPGSYRLFVICGNLSANKTPGDPLLGKRENAELCFTPTSVSRANPIKAHSGPLRTFAAGGPGHTVLARRLQDYPEPGGVHGQRASVAVMSARPFEIVCEIEPPVRPDLTHARHQIGVLTAVSSTFLIPDNHIGRATVSSIAVAHEVQAMGGHSIACINSRDRNLLGFRRDLLTAAAYGVGQFLFVYGDKPGSGTRTSDLTVRSMIEEARSCTAADPAFAGIPAWRIGVAAALRPLPRWKHAADFIFSQVSYSADTQLRWRDANPVDVPVYAGVMVLASAAMARRLAATIPDIEIPGWLAGKVAHDKMAGVEAACEQITRLRDSGAFDGVHLVPVNRYREISARLEALARQAQPARHDGIPRT